MYLLLELILALTYFFALSQAQHSLSTDQRRSSYSYDQHSASSFINPYSVSAGSYKHSSNKHVLPSHRATKRNYEAVSYPSYTSYRRKPHLGSYLNTNSFKTAGSSNSAVKKSISKADADNAKFVGAENQENDNDSRTLHLKRKKIHRLFNTALANPCLLYGRDASKSITSQPKQQERFLWDINVHNYYPSSQIGFGGCGGYGGFGNGFAHGGFGSGLLSDQIGPNYYAPGVGIANFLRLFAPGILQNSLAATVRPQQFGDESQTVNENDLQSDPLVDPNYRPASPSIPVRKPNVVFYDSAGAVSNLISTQCF